MLSKIIYIDEPELLFAGNQSAIDPRDGLLLYGPYEKWGEKFKLNTYSIAAGVIGSSDALFKYRNFVKQIKKPIISIKRNKNGMLVSNEVQRPSYPGFEAIFNIHWPEEPELFCEINSADLDSIFSRSTNRKIRTAKIVDLYLDKMTKASNESDYSINLWFVIVPKKIFNNCRTKKGYGTDFDKSIIKYYEMKSLGQGHLFNEEEMFGDDISSYFDSSSDFHHLLKAKANQAHLSSPIQILVEPKLEFRDILTNISYSDDMKASLAWNLSTTIYYKLGKKPWKLYNIRSGVCYLGLVFKKFQNQHIKNMICSAAQLFLSDGDGTVFRGNNGLWIGENPNEHHLDESESFNLLNLALNDYYENNKIYPNELFIHGRAAFSDKEWNGFLNAVESHNAATKLVGVVIKDEAPLKFFRDVDAEKSNYGVMRGIAVIINQKEAFLFTRGFVPRLNTSMSMEIPNSLHIKVVRGDVDIEIVLKDIMALTKVNYNTCLYGDGKPVTLRFSDTIGSILTATGNWKEERRQFRFYI